MNNTSDPHADVPIYGALLGIDYGTVRIGIAISTPDQVIASPLEIYHPHNDDQDARYYKQVIEDYRIKGIVIGLPIHLSGHESQMSQEVREFGKWLGEVTGLPYTFCDERFTSSVAEDHLIGIDMTRQQRKKRLDMIAAQILLQAFVDCRKKQQTERDYQASIDNDDSLNDEEE